MHVYFGGETVARSAKTAARDAEIFERWIKREKQSEIAASLGISQPSVAAAVKREREARGDDLKAELRARWLGLYEHCIDELYKIVDAGPIPAYSNGRPIYLNPDGDDGKIAQDYSGLVRAMAEMRAQSESARKMLGIDEPVRATVDATVRFEVVGIDTEALT